VTSLSESVTPPYIADIRSQPEALQRLLDQGLPTPAQGLLQRLPTFGRVIMTGMGASLHALYPGFLALAAAGVPVWCIEAAELLSDAGGLVTADSLLWVTSQSGRSAEIAPLLARSPRPRAILAVTNDVTGPLAAAADAVIELCSGEEHTVGTRSYLNSLAAHLMATEAALGRPVPRDVYDMPLRLAGYLKQWDDHLAAWDAAVSQDILFTVGRGASLAAARTGALIVKEAAKTPLEAMSAPQFRHGPLEMADAATCVIVLPGTAADAVANDRLAADLSAVGANAVRLTEGQGPGRPGRAGPWMPEVGADGTRPIAEIMPFQLLSVLLAQRRGLEPGAFRQIGKVTTTL
jgi:glutamine---fructose-6-phosphate transaminase (isomerizing)